MPATIVEKHSRHRKSTKQKRKVRGPYDGNKLRAKELKSKAGEWVSMNWWGEGRTKPDILEAQDIYIMKAKMKLAIKGDSIAVKVLPLTYTFSGYIF